jgi:hypothetical protein
MYEYAQKDDIDLLQFETQVINENQKLKDFKDRKIIYKDENVIIEKLFELSEKKK